MAWNYTGRARVNPSAPEAAGICDRCGFRYTLSDLKFQHDWYANALRKLNLRVCPRCLDKPAEFRRAIRLPPDPVPVKNPRPPGATDAVNHWDAGLRWDDPTLRWDVPLPGDEL